MRPWICRLAESESDLSESRGALLQSRAGTVGGRHEHHHRGHQPGEDLPGHLQWRYHSWDNMRTIRASLHKDEADSVQGKDDFEIEISVI